MLQMQGVRQREHMRARQGMLHLQGVWRRQHFACSVPLHSSRPSLTLLRSVALNPATGGGAGSGGLAQGVRLFVADNLSGFSYDPRDLEHAP